MTITIEDAFENSKQLCDVCDIKSEPACNECLERVRLEALEKQIPQKVLIWRDIDDILGRCPLGRCPNCQEGANDTDKYCSRCGQRLDWSGEE